MWINNQILQTNNRKGSREHEKVTALSIRTRNALFQASKDSGLAEPPRLLYSLTTMLQIPPVQYIIFFFPPSLSALQKNPHFHLRQRSSGSVGITSFIFHPVGREATPAQTQIGDLLQGQSLTESDLSASFSEEGLPLPRSLAGSRI